MHPLLGRGAHLAFYLASWALIGTLVAFLIASTAAISAAQACLLTVPPALVYAFFCLAAWFPARATPLRRATLWRAVGSQAVAALLSSSVVQLVTGLWAGLLESRGLAPGATELLERNAPLLFVLGLLLYSLAAVVSSLILTIEASRVAERQAAEIQHLRDLANQEIELARALQRRLLPAAEARGVGFALAARNLAAQGVAGDFYDYFQLPDGRLSLAVADVAGKGLAASLIMATVKAILPLVARERSVTATLAELNRRLKQQLGPREFVAMALASFDPRTGNLELTNAGLPDPYLLRLGCPPVAVTTPMPRLPLGLRADLDYSSVALDLAPGDRLLMITDGLPEAALGHGEPLGYEAFERELDHGATTPGAWLDVLITRLQTLSQAAQEDDWTMLLLERSS
jgi:serine phosphatase RsbU (regulator of sigma subunit)